MVNIKVAYYITWYNHFLTRNDYKNRQLKWSYAKNTPCLLDTKFSEQSELLKTLRCEAYAEFTQCENKKTNMRTPHWNKNKKTPQCQCCDQWSHPPCITHIPPHALWVSLISVSLWEGVLALLLTWKGTENMGPPEVHTGPVWNQNSDMLVSKYSLMSKQKVWPVAWSRRGLQISSPTTSTLVNKAVEQFSVATDTQCWTPANQNKMHHSRTNQPEAS